MASIDAEAFKNGSIDRAKLTETIVAFVHAHGNKEVLLPVGTEVVVRKRIPKNLLNSGQSLRGPRHSLVSQEPLESERGDDYTYSVYGNIVITGDNYIPDPENPLTNRLDSQIPHMNISLTPNGRHSNNLLDEGTIVYVIQATEIRHQFGMIPVRKGDVLILRSGPQSKRLGGEPVRPSNLHSIAYRFAPAKKETITVQADSFHAVNFNQLERI